MMMEDLFGVFFIFQEPRHLLLVIMILQLQFGISIQKRKNKYIGVKLIQLKSKSIHRMINFMQVIIMVLFRYGVLLNIKNVKSLKTYIILIIQHQLICVHMIKAFALIAFKIVQHALALGIIAPLALIVRICLIQIAYHHVLKVISQMKEFVYYNQQMKQLMRHKHRARLN